MLLKLANLGCASAWPLSLSRRFIGTCSTHRDLLGPYRSHFIHELKNVSVGTKVRVCGRISHIRPLGHINFIVMTDHNESIQAVFKRTSPNFNADLVSKIQSLRANSFCTLEGTVINLNEITLDDIVMHSHPDASVIRWPIQTDTHEDVRSRLRFLSLREPELQHRLKLRSRVSHSIRCLLHSLNFTEVDTPVLTASSPEGAREFLIPTRKRNQFFALAQSPQQYKQLLMAGGFESYFQFARCFRDEDGRSDRQSEFTQLDIEMAYVTSREIMLLTEMVLWRLSNDYPERQLGFPTGNLTRYSYDYVMKQYGSDKPDLRSKQLILNDISGDWAAVLCEKAGKQVSELGLEGVIVWAYEGLNYPNYPDAIPKHIIEKCQEKFSPNPGDCIILSTSRIALGSARNKLVPWLNDRGLLPFDEESSWIWVTEFPLFHLDSESSLCSCHHPFTAPMNIQELYEAQFNRDALLGIKANSYDLVVNGTELGGGSIRIHDYNIQKLVLSLLKSDDNLDSFQALLSALRHGCPPHGGIALGMDRLMSLFSTTASSLRDVIAFPKSSLGRDIMMGAPGPPHGYKMKELKELGIYVQSSMSSDYRSIKS